MRRLLTFGLAASLALRTFGQTTVRSPASDPEIAQVLYAAPNCRSHGVSGGVTLDLRGIYIDSSLLWFVFRGVNRSAIDFRAGRMRFFVRDRRAIKRRAVQELPLYPVVWRDVPTLRADSVVQICYGLAPRVPRKSQELVIEWVEKNGDRRLQLRVPAKNILTAHRL